VAQQDVTEFLGQDPTSLLFRGEAVMAGEDDRPLAGNVSDGTAHPVDEDTFHD